MKRLWTFGILMNIVGLLLKGAVMGAEYGALNFGTKKIKEKLEEFIARKEAELKNQKE